MECQLAAMMAEVCSTLFVAWQQQVPVRLCDLSNMSCSMHP